MDFFWDFMTERTNADIVAMFKHDYCLTYYIGTSPYEKPGAVYVHNWATGRGIKWIPEKKDHHYFILIDYKKEQTIGYHDMVDGYCERQEPHPDKYWHKYKKLYLCPFDVGWGYVPVPEGLPVPKWLHKEVNNL